ncbi:MAG: hypothetical protein K2X97_20550 [Mycobacteriaceae bacterium]|nr:hypothetical protein [Mycobacteriaceae bacterium]
MSGHALMETVLLIGLLAVGAVIFYFGYSYFESRRNTRISNARAQLRQTPGVNLTAGGTVPFESLNLPRFWVFEKVRYPVSHLLYGEVQGVNVMIFDCDPGRQIKRGFTITTVVWFREPALRLPSFGLRPRWAHQVLELTGKRDVDLPRHPEFSERFLIFGHPQGMQHLFTDAVVRAISHYPNVCIALSERLHRGLGRSDGRLRGAKEGQPARHSRLSQ